MTPSGLPESLPPPPPFRMDRFAALLATRWLGRRLELHDSLGSSNDRALELGREPDGHGALVLAEEQPRARGRHGRVWQAIRGQGVWASVALRPSPRRTEVAQIPLLAGLALCEALALDLGVPEVSLRWPNDVDVRGRKVAGILCERAGGGTGVVAVGSGINVGPAAVPPGLEAAATSLAREGVLLDREAVLAAYLGRLESRLDQWERDGFEAAREDYLGRLSGKGCEVRVRQAAGAQVSGRIETVDSSGALVLRTGEGLKAFHAGEVERVR